MAIFIILLILLVVTALWTVMTPRLLLAAIGLAVTSAVLAIVMFAMGAPWAAVLELSVCAGLITVVFVSAISLVGPATREEEKKLAMMKLKRFAALPLIVIAGSIFIFVWHQAKDLPISISTGAAVAGEVREVLWQTRQIDLLGQILIMLTGVFGIVILFKTLAAKKLKANK